MSADARGAHVRRMRVAEARDVDYFPELIFDHPGLLQRRLRLENSKPLIVIFGGQWRGMPVNPAGSQVFELPMVPGCCPLGARLHVESTSNGLYVSNRGRQSWRKQVWEKPTYADAVEIPPKTGSDGMRVDGEKTRLATIWLGAWDRGSPACWRLGLVNPAGVQPGSLASRHSTVSSERPIKLSPEELDAIFERYGAFLSFPAARRPMVRVPQAGQAPHIENVRTRAMDNGFRPGARNGDSGDVGLLTFLLSTGSVLYEDLLREMERRGYEHIELLRPPPQLPLTMR